MKNMPSQMAYQPPGTDIPSFPIQVIMGIKEVFPFKKQKKTLAWWDKSIKIGEYLVARPELARTCMEVGKRLLEQKSKFQQLNGIQAEECLKKVRVLCKEMEMEWDLEQLDKIRS